MTKKELLQKIEDASDDEISEIIFGAMDEYAKQKAIAFKEWCIGNEWQENTLAQYSHTTEQLFDIFNSEVEKEEHK